MRSRGSRAVTALLLSSLVAGAAGAGVVVVNYTVDAGGLNTEPLNGLSARATFDLNGTTLKITLQNTSTGVPTSFEPSDSLLVSLGFNLPNSLLISSGVSAKIAPGSIGLGSWNARGAGDSVAEEWLWTNENGGDVMKAWTQIISTSNGQGGGKHTRFDGVVDGDVDGPFGGMAANPPHRQIPNNQPAVSDSIEFTVALSGAVTMQELQTLADGSIVEFGSDMRYLTVVPAPGALAALLLAGASTRRRRRHA